MNDLLHKNDVVVFSTREYAQASKRSVSAASHYLQRLAKKGFVQMLTRGVWIKRNHPYFSPFSVVSHLLGGEQGYISFLSALNRHGAISQIPTRVQIATTGHSRILKTSVGIFEFFQMNPRMMHKGVEWSITAIPFRMASLEKAFLDVIYLSTRKGKRFASLPELDHHQMKFNSKTFLKLIEEQVSLSQIKQAIKIQANRLGLI